MVLHIVNLFGYFDYRFTINEKGITILTGPNGFGKSTIIKCLEAISNGDLEYFLNLNFERVEIIHRESLELVIEKTEKGLIVNDEEIPRRFIAYWSKGLMPRRRLDGNTETQEEERFLYQIYSFSLKKMRRILGEAVLIQEQRLLKKETRKFFKSETSRNTGELPIVETVLDIPKRLSDRMREVENQYSRTASLLDSTYPERLFRQDKGITQEEFSGLLSQMREKIDKLNRNGISQISNLQINNYREEDARALKIYFEDFDKKYKEYEELVDRLELFIDIVNARFMFKKLYVKADKGIYVSDNKTGNEIPLKDLSSGEKEIIVLFYSLIFDVRKQSLLLIDEPEISLHIAWQRMFIDDLKKITKLNELTVVVATHSPQLINGNRHLQIDLGEIYKDGLNKK